MERQTNSLGKSRGNITGLLSRTAITIAMVLALALLTTQPVHAQTFSLFHTVSGGGLDGVNHTTGVIVAGLGVLYGTCRGSSKTVPIPPVPPADAGAATRTAGA